MVKRILVPLDGSRKALKALPLAACLAKLYQGELSLLTVTYFAASTDPGHDYSSAWLESPLVGSVQEFTNQVFSTAKEQITEDVKLATYHLQGQPEEEILKFIANHEVDMVVVGCKNLSFVDHILRGSVSRQILEKAKCPVIIVK